MEHEELIRELILAGDESNKVDFKEHLNLKSNQERMGLAKLVSAIANTDDPSYDNYGYVILGAKRGEIVGGMDELAEDRFSASLHQSVNAFLDPQVRFNVKAFRDEDKGWFGAIVIAPGTPQERPHFIAREGKDGNREIYKGQCFVRYGDRTDLAQKNDFERMYSARFEAQIEGLRQMLQERALDKPRLIVGFDTETGPSASIAATVFQLCNHPDFDEVLENEEESLSKLLEPNPRAVFLPSIFALTDADRERFRISIPSYINKLSEYYDQLHTAKTEFARTIEITLMAHNTGAVPAVAVDLTLTFPTSLQILCEGDIPKAPDAPSRPKLSSSTFTALSGMQRVGMLDSYTRALSKHAFPDIAPPPNIQLSLDKTKNQVLYRIGKLSQHVPQHLPTFYAIAEVQEESTRQHNISCRVRADNLSSVEELILGLEVTTETKEWNDQELPCDDEELGPDEEA